MHLNFRNNNLKNQIWCERQVILPSCVVLRQKQSVVYNPTMSISYMSLICLLIPHGSGWQSLPFLTHTRTTVTEKVIRSHHFFGYFLSVNISLPCVSWNVHMYMYIILQDQKEDECSKLLFLTSAVTLYSSCLFSPVSCLFSQQDAV